MPACSQQACPATLRTVHGEGLHEGMACLSCSALPEPGGLWTHPSKPSIFHLFTVARNSSGTGPSSRASFTTTPCDCSSRLAAFPAGCHVPSRAIGKEEASLGPEPAFQQCGRTGLRSLGGRGTLGFAPLLKRGNQEQKQLVFHSAV